MSYKPKSRYGPPVEGKKRGKKFRPGTELAGLTSSFSKLRRIKHVVNSWKEMNITNSQDAILRIVNILEG